MDRPNIPALTSTRFFAALLVVIFHYSLNRQVSVFGSVSSFGYEAVTFFFVLSGFILTYAHLETGHAAKLNLSARAFMAHRVARIAPAYFVGLSLAAPFFVAGYALHHDISPSLFAAGLLLVPTALQAWYPPAATLWNIPAWSLSVEVFLYASFVPFVYLVNRTGQIRLLIGAFALVCATAAVKAYLDNDGSLTSNAWWHNFSLYFPFWHLPQFILGIALGRLFVSDKKIAKATYDTILTVSLLAVCVIIAIHGSSRIFSSNAVLAPAFGMLIFGGAGAAGRLSKVLSNRSLVLLGNASYAIYIVHVPIWMWWFRITDVYLQTRLAPIIDFTIYMLIVIASSVFVYLYVERPGRRWVLRQAAK
jgi:peptidoglycan/LPS O-acetylase OafA/YrhL